MNQDGGFKSTYLSDARGKCVRAPAWFINIFKYPTPHATKRDPDDDNFLSYEDLLLKQAFGFITYERYMSSHQGKTSKTGSKDGQDMDFQIKKKVDGIFNQQSVAME
jgi:hypothetical protein